MDLIIISQKRIKIMKTTEKIALILMVAFTLTTAIGCAPSARMFRTGFLTDYSLLEEQSEGMVQWVYIKDGVDFAAYDKIMIDRITFFFKDDAAYKGIKPEELLELAQHFYDAYWGILINAYTITNKPGPRTLRVRTAITSLVPSKPVSGTLSTVMPPALVASHLKKAATGVHIGMGQMSGEAELIDSKTGEVLAMALDTETGKKYKLAKNFTKWGQVKEIAKEWVASFAKRLDKLSGRN